MHKGVMAFGNQSWVIFGNLRSALLNGNGLRPRRGGSLSTQRSGLEF